MLARTAEFGTALARSRAGLALRRPHNWIQLAKFCAVGASGYVVNLGVYALLLDVAGVDFRAAAVCSFLVAVTNNYTWNRVWTFRGQRGHFAYQGMRFLVVSVAALAAQPRLPQHPRRARRGQDRGAGGRDRARDAGELRRRTSSGASLPSGRCALRRRDRAPGAARRPGGAGAHAERARRGSGERVARPSEPSFETTRSPTGCRATRRATGSSTPSSTRPSGSGACTYGGATRARSPPGRCRRTAR